MILSTNSPKIRLHGNIEKHGNASGSIPHRCPHITPTTTVTSPTPYRPPSIPLLPLLQARSWRSDDGKRRCQSAVGVVAVVETRRPCRQSSYWWYWRRRDQPAASALEEESVAPAVGTSGPDPGGFGSTLEDFYLSLLTRNRYTVINIEAGYTGTLHTLKLLSLH